MKEEQDILKSIQLFIDVVGYRKDFLTKRLDISLEEFEKRLNGEEGDAIEFAKQMAGIHNYNDFFFLDNRVEMYIQSQVLGMALRGDSFEKYVPKKNIKKIRQEVELYQTMEEEIRRKSEELEELKSKQNLKRIDIEELL